MQVKLFLDDDLFERLSESAMSERRPLPDQAEVILRRALGLPFPIPLKDKPRADRPARAEGELQHVS